MTGILGVSCALASSLKAGVSGKERRIQNPTATTMALRKNGTRQPHERSWSSGSAEIGRKTIVARMKPICVPLRVKLVKKAAPVLRCVLERHRIGAGLLAGGRKPLQQAQQHEQDGRRDTDLAVRGKRADEKGRKAHQEQGEGEDPLASELVADVAHEEGADRPRDVADAEGRERGDRAELGVDRGKEDLCEYERGSGAVDEEIVVLDGAADPARQGGLLRRALRLHLGSDGGRRGRHAGLLVVAFCERRDQNVLTGSQILISGNP